VLGVNTDLQREKRQVRDEYRLTERDQTSQELVQTNRERTDRKRATLG
jgi:hypothetical protein